MVRIRRLPLDRLVGSQASQVLALGLVVNGIAKIVVIPFLFAGFGLDRRLLVFFLKTLLFKRLFFLRAVIVLCSGLGLSTLPRLVRSLNRAVFAVGVLSLALLAAMVFGVCLISRLVLDRAGGRGFRGL